MKQNSYMSKKYPDLRGSLQDESIYYTKDNCNLVFSGSIDNLMTLPDVLKRLSSYDDLYEVIEVCSEFSLKYSYKDETKNFRFLPEAHDVLPEIMENYKFDDYYLSLLIVGACFDSFVSNQRLSIIQKSEFYDMIDDLESLPIALQIILMQRAELGMIVSRDEGRIFKIALDSILKECQSRNSNEEFNAFVRVVDNFSSLLKPTSN
ncbi:hypothetical protein HOJ01_03135 [bacterium]|jgi:hypothetical protein|nr:hypothetical protein [bacterium]MBT6293778.1 hypothetical protein [bacterium]